MTFKADFPKSAQMFAKITKYILRPNISSIQKMPQNKYQGLKYVPPKKKKKKGLQ